MVRFVVENMNCAGCAKGVTATVKATDPTAQIEVHLDRKEVAVSGGHTDSDTLRNALHTAGWKAEAAPA
ncbi:heavy-metal-associated domain-containing protein [Teichococcus aestuarii]|nr:heavy-metal-associated domain-containing protein [Pseudoroseomonas aestuarii]